MRGVLVCGFLAIMMLVGGCGGGGNTPKTGTSSNNTIAGMAANVQPITVDPGPANFVNTLFTSVTVCVPGTANCQTIDHVQVDTGSSGLRIMASALPGGVVLPPQLDQGANPIAECMQFADGYSWGPVKLADVKIAGEQTSAKIPVQVIGDPVYSGIPNSCSSSGPAENTVATFGANGLLGVGVLKQDCGSMCATVAANGFYYTCPTTVACQETAQDLDQQVSNPVALFANDNNGVIVELPPIPSSGAASVSGALVFGIGTQANNDPGAAKIFQATPDSGTFTTNYNNRFINFSLFDTGSSALYFSDGNTPLCNPNDVAADFYCPASTQTLSATIVGTHGVGAVLGFSVANATDLFNNNPSSWAFNNVAAPMADSFIWGLPAFYGRNVFVAIEGQNTKAGLGPYFAF